VGTVTQADHLKLLPDDARMTYEEAVRLGREARDFQWKLGDLASAVVTGYGKGRLEQYAADIGVEYGALRQYRLVAQSYEIAKRFAISSWSVHMIFASQDDRAELVQRQWTASEARAEVKRRKPVTEKKDEDVRANTWEELVPDAVKALQVGEKAASAAKRLGIAADRMEKAMIFAKGLAAAPKTAPSPSGRRQNLNGKTNPQRVRELQADKKRPGAHADLVTFQLKMAQLCSTLEYFSVQDYGTAETDLWLMTDIFDDLTSLGEWYDRQLSAVTGYLIDRGITEKLTKLRDNTGRTPEEAETAGKLADRIEKKLQNRLAS
jgi:hypothetical protein